MTRRMRVEARVLQDTCLPDLGIEEVEGGEAVAVASGGGGRDGGDGVRGTARAEEDRGVEERGHVDDDPPVGIVELEDATEGRFPVLCEVIDDSKAFVVGIEVGGEEVAGGHARELDLDACALGARVGPSE